MEFEIFLSNCTYFIKYQSCCGDLSVRLGQTLVLGKLIVGIVIGQDLLMLD